MTFFAGKQERLLSIETQLYWAETWILFSKICQTHLSCRDLSSFFFSGDVRTKWNDVCLCLHQSMHECVYVCESRVWEEVRSFPKQTNKQTNDTPTRPKDAQDRATELLWPPSCRVLCKIVHFFWTVDCTWTWFQHLPVTCLDIRSQCHSGWGSGGTEVGGLCIVKHVCVFSKGSWGLGFSFSLRSTFSGSQTVTDFFSSHPSALKPVIQSSE